MGLGIAGCALLPGDDGGSGRAPAWRTRVHVPLGDANAGAAVAATADSVVVRIGRSVVGLDRSTGRQRWNYQGRQGDIGDSYVDVAVTADAVAVSGRRKGEGLWLDVLDAASGRRLWSHRAEDGDVTVFRDAVYTADCGRVCVVSRRDPRTGEVRWSLREPSPARIDPPGLGTRIGRTEPRALEAGPVGPYVVLVRGDGRGARDRVNVLEASTGRRLAQAHFTGWTTIATPRALVVGRPVDERDEDPQCRYTLRASDVRDGTPRWRGEVSTHFSKRDDKAGCSGLFADGTYALGLAPDLLLATTADGRPQAFDLTTGKSRWAAQRTGVPIDVGGSTVLVRDGADRGAIRALDLTTGRQLWQGWDPGSSVRTVVLEGSVLVPYLGSPKEGFGGRVAVLDASDGRRRWTSPKSSGHLAGAGDGWFATVPLSGVPEGTVDVLFYPVEGGTGS